MRLRVLWNGLPLQWGSANKVACEQTYTMNTRTYIMNAILDLIIPTHTFICPIGTPHMGNLENWARSYLTAPNLMLLNNLTNLHMMPWNPLYTFGPLGVNGPQAKSHLHSVGPHPSHPSFAARSSCLHLHGNSSSLRINVTIPNHLSHLKVIWHVKEFHQLNWE